MLLSTQKGRKIKQLVDNKQCNKYLSFENDIIPYFLGILSQGLYTFSTHSVVPNIWDRVRNAESRLSSRLTKLESTF